MQQPVDAQVSAELLKQLQRVQERAGRSGLSPTLIALVCLRVTQLNGCARSLPVHATAARTAGETERRLAALPLWQGSPLFTDLERAALAWSEAATQAIQSRIPQTAWERLTPQLAPGELVELALATVRSEVPDELWARLTPQLTPQQIDDLTLLVTVLNTRNHCANAGGPTAA